MKEFVLLFFLIWLAGVNVIGTKCQRIRNRVLKYRKECHFINILKKYKSILDEKLSFVFINMIHIQIDNHTTTD